MKILIITLTIVIYIVMLLGSILHIYLTYDHNRSLTGLIQPAKTKAWIKIFGVLPLVALFIAAFYYLNN